MKHRIAFLVSLSLVIWACKNNPTDPSVDQLPEGYQIDIKWSSLADSPCPIYHGDAQSTGRSKNSGPTSGIVSSKIPVEGMQGGVTIAKDSSIYYISYNLGYLYSLDSKDNQRWKIPIPMGSSSTPLITSDGAIIINSGPSSSIIAFGSDGNKKWEFKADKNVWNISMGVGLDGTLYFVDSGNTLYALDNEGKLKWKLNDQRFMSYLPTVPVFSPDGKTLYLQGYHVSILAIDVVNHSVKWEYGTESSLSSPLVDCFGNIYILQGESYSPVKVFYSLDQNGNIRWQYKFDGYLSNNVEPTMDRYGNVYFGNDSLYSFTYKGDLRWAYNLQNNRHINTSLICDKDDNIYFGSSKDYYDNYIIKFSSEGKLLWEIPVKDERSLGSSPVITTNRELIFPTFRSNNLLIIK